MKGGEAIRLKALYMLDIRHKVMRQLVIERFGVRQSLDRAIDVRAVEHKANCWLSGNWS